MNKVVLSKESILMICDGLDRILSDPNDSKGFRIGKARRIVQNLKAYTQKNVMSKNEFYSKQQEPTLEPEMINKRLEELKRNDPRTD